MEECSVIAHQADARFIFACLYSLSLPSPGMVLPTRGWPSNINKQPRQAITRMSTGQCDLGNFSKETLSSGTPGYITVTLKASQETTQQTFPHSSSSASIPKVCFNWSFKLGCLPKIFPKTLGLRFLVHFYCVGTGFTQTKGCLVRGSKWFLVQFQVRLGNSSVHIRRKASRGISFLLSMHFMSISNKFHTDQQNSGLVEVIHVAK